MCFCQGIFSRSEKLKSPTNPHWRKTFKCNLCRASFSRSENLKLKESHENLQWRKSSNKMFYVCVIYVVEDSMSRELLKGNTYIRAHRAEKQNVAKEYSSSMSDSFSQSYKMKPHIQWLKNQWLKAKYSNVIYFRQALVNLALWINIWSDTKEHILGKKTLLAWSVSAKL